MSNIAIDRFVIAESPSLRIDLVRHLRYFTVVADELHFGRAAERLHMAQPPLSQRIQRLERELGVRLFERSSRQVSLTPAGRALVGPAHDVLAAVDRLVAGAGEVAGGAAGRLRLGLLPETGAATMAAVVRRVARSRPALGLDLSGATTSEALRALADRSLDVATVRFPVEEAGLLVGPVLHQPWGVVLPAGSPLARRRRVVLADLGDTPLALFPRATAPGFHDELADACARRGWQPAAIHHPGGTAAALALALAGTAATLVDATTARREPGVAWRPLAGDPLVARVALVWPTARGTGAAVEAVAAAVAEALGRDHGMTPAPDTAPVVHVRPASAVLT
jgi:DNA-binding transcriptional LysR family regulator